MRMRMEIMLMPSVAFDDSRSLCEMDDDSGDDHSVTDDANDGDFHHLPPPLHRPSLRE